MLQKLLKNLSRLKLLLWKLEHYTDYIDEKLFVVNQELQSQRDLLTALQRGVPAESAAEKNTSPHSISSTETERLTRENIRLRNSLTGNAKALAWLIEQERGRLAPLPASDLKFSIIMPTWNRDYVIEKAIRSILQQHWQNWECWIIDDGSTDETAQRVAPFLQDQRFHYLQTPHAGAAAARNIGLKQATGELIAYLDTDNEWLPNYLTTLTQAFTADPQLMAAYTCQVIVESNHEEQWLRGQPFDYAQLLQGNYIDLNVFSHRRVLMADHGLFDETLSCLQDWDLLLRYTRESSIKFLSVLGGIYYHGLPDQITARESGAHARFVIEGKHCVIPATRSPRVLYAVWHYPQLSESYVRTEINAAQRLGVEIEVWSEETVAAPFESEAPIHRGSLRAAIEAFKPDIVHVHWLDMAARYLPEITAAGLLMTARGHGFEFTPGLVAQLLASDAVRGVYLFPHLAEALHIRNSKLKALPVQFNSLIYQPEYQKDRRKVLRVGCALPTKDYAGFFEIARQCPDQQFILVLCRAYQLESYADELLQMRDQMQAPVTIHLDLQHEEIAALMKETGIYLHTFGMKQPYGMPISISEALASGCYVIARNAPGAAGYVGTGGALYDTTAQATQLIRSTLSWTDTQWRTASQAAVNQAFSHYADLKVVERLVADWRAMAAPQ